MTSERGGSAGARIGATFARAAMGPVEYAAGCITANKIPSGLEELAPDGLVAAYARGVEDVAKLVGVPRAEVERFLPLDQVASVEARLRSSHPIALGAWRMFAGHFGFLDVVTALTVDGRPPDIGLCLERVAGKVRADKELARPLAALAADVAEWSALVERSRTVLEEGTWLATVLRRRALARAAFAIAATGMLAALTAAIVVVRVGRDRLDARLAGPDPCVAFALGEGEVRFASSDQQARIRSRQGECEGARAEAEERRRREEALAKATLEAERKREETIRACATLADEVVAGALSQPSRELAGEAAARVERVAKRALEPADVGPTDPVLPCEDTPARERLEEAFAGALLADLSVWTRRGDPSPLVRRLLVARKNDLPARALLGLADNAERTAKRALTRGETDVMARAKRLCGLARELGTPGLSSCEAVEKL